MSSQSPVNHFIDADQVGWIVFDDPNGRANIFNPTTQAALGEAIEALKKAAPKAVVLISAKEKIFIAGADLKWLAKLSSVAEAETASHAGQRLFARLETLGVPVVCAIHGACAGGGYEMALACDWRIASDAKETVIGLPEVGIGLIPGWGGCARLPRLIGVMAAVEHILKAALVPSAEALRVGLVDEVVLAAELKEKAKAAALRLASEGKPQRPTVAVVEEGFFANQIKTVAGRMRGQPAPLAVLGAIGQSIGVSLEKALEIEASNFGGVAAGEVAKNLIQVFFLKDAVKKSTMDAWFPNEPATVLSAPSATAPFQIIGVIGAGVMGSGIAQWCVMHGYGVMLCDSNGEALDRGVAVIRALFADLVKRGKMTSAQAHKSTGSIGITTSVEDLESCDLIIEAIVEDVAAKRKVYAQLSKVLPPECLVASNTSALPIDEIMAPLAGQERTLGLHFFNPVGRMPLVEMVVSPHTSRATADRALAFVKKLGKTPVICRSSPGFFVTRVLFFYLNEACRLWEQGVPTETLDRAMRDWGWPMGPMRLIDEVGVDVTDFIYGEMKHYFPERFLPTSVCGKLLAAGLRGRKNGTSAGFYAFAEGEKLNPAVEQFAPAAKIDMSDEAIAAKLNGVMIEETKRVLAEGVLKSPDDADLALLMGAGFPAFRGGLMRYARSVEMA
ncbi:3-hydroxyacyl-CoA dehydrogenase NAD-binding domain-containing protein [Oleiharenicola lentus]|uniref:3-hydroxyacyl-CoA dehydrogenase NAD-binding domain-containing protein n=1 Tax=Oleiharenicola lentus TaxID=2508720 RepID=UPI003F66C358